MIRIIHIPAMNTIRRRMIRTPRPEISEKTKKNPTVAFAATPEEYEAIRGLAAIQGVSMSSILFLYGQRQVLDLALEHWEKVKKSVRTKGR